MGVMGLRKRSSVASGWPGDGGGAAGPGATHLGRRRTLSAAARGSVRDDAAAATIAAAASLVAI